MYLNGLDGIGYIVRSVVACRQSEEGSLSSLVRGVRWIGWIDSICWKQIVCLLIEVSLRNRNRICVVYHCYSLLLNGCNCYLLFVFRIECSWILDRIHLFTCLCFYSYWISIDLYSISHLFGWLIPINSHYYIYLNI